MTGGRCWAGWCGVGLLAIVPTWASAQAATVRRVGPPPLVVSDIAVAPGPDRSIWVATKGGGLFRLAAGTAPEHLDMGPSLPSATVTSVQPLADGKALAATPQGLVTVDPRARSYRFLPRLRVPVELARQSPLDRSVLVQLPPEVAKRLGESTGLLRLTSDLGVMRTADLVAEGQERATVATLDPLRDCLHVAGTVRTKSGLLQPFLSTECNAATKPQRDHWIFAAGAPAETIAVAALAAAPGSDRVMMALVTQNGGDTNTRRYRLVEANAGVLRDVCKAAEFDATLTGLVAIDDGWVVALDGKGLFTLDCDSPPALLLDGKGAFRHPTALVRHPDGRLLIGTDRGVYAWQMNAAAPVPLLVATGGDMPPEAIPTDLAVDRAGPPRVLVSSAVHGFVELRLSDPWKIERAWRAGDSIPERVAYGRAQYAAERGDVLLVAMPSQGISSLDASGLRPLRTSVPLLSPEVVQLVVDVPGGGFWVGTGGTPVDPEGGGIQHFSMAGEHRRSIPIRDRQLLPASMWLDGSSVWIGSRAGLLRVAADKPLSRLSTNRVQTVSRNASHGLTAVVGASVERWNGTRLEPVLFAVPEKSMPAGGLGHPVDVVVDNQRRWSILYSTGRLVLLGSDRRFVAVLGIDQHLPASAARLVHLPDTDTILVGTREEGLFVLKRTD